MTIFQLSNDLQRALSAEAEEYTNCISVEGLQFPNMCPEYDTKKSDGEAPVNGT